jgi:thiol-disulfide isomerase/thioredoxin
VLAVTGCGILMTMPGADASPEKAPVRLAAAPPTPKELADKLFSNELEEAAFQQAVVAARKGGVPEPIVYEARLIRLVELNDTERLVKLLPEGEKYLGKEVNPAQNRVLRKANEAEGILFGLRALDAAHKDDAAGFEQAIKEAFWKAPGLARVLGGWVQDFQQQQRMANLVLPLDLPLKTSEGKTTTLKQLLGTHKALLLDFWASWCTPCMNAMPELKSRGQKLAPQGVVVVGINTENDAASAARVKADQKIDLPWLLEPADEPYSGLLDIDSIPRAILVSAAGKVLYNGHPAAAKLGQALAKLGVTL